MALALAVATGFLRTLAVAHRQKPYVVDATPGYGLTFEGIGAISGGGATSRLLFDYPSGAASDILDYLFKPDFALSLQMLKVEVGGDTDATEGAEPSHMHRQGQANFRRGYEWWLMKEAKKRNPNIKLYALPWGFPGWLDPNATADRAPVTAFADVRQTADYTLQWIKGAKKVHGLDIDYVGQWNENDAPPEYAEILKKLLADEGLRTTVLDRMAHYTGSGSIDTTAPNAGMQTGLNQESGNSPDPHSCDEVNWNETSRGWDDEEGSTHDTAMENQKGGFQQSARCLARVVNRGYLNQCRTATIQWYLIDSFYSFLPWPHCGLGIANEPWSGHYEIRSPLWALAHTTQFSEVGWRYLRHDYGVGKLRRGGSYVTRVSPDGEDWSMVIEKMVPSNSSCTRGSNPNHITLKETVKFQVQGALAKKKTLYVWWSDLNTAEEIPTVDVFRKQSDIQLADDGMFTLEVGVNEVFTVTTLSTKGKRGHHRAPTAAPFPDNYSDDFEHTRPRHPPRYWYDQMGAWEVQHDHSTQNMVMRQVVTIWPNCWGYSCTGPRTYFGPTPLVNSKVSMDVMLEDDAKWTLNNLTIGTDGKWTFGRLEGRRASFEKNAWHHVEYTVTPEYTSVSVDGKELFYSSDPDEFLKKGRHGRSLLRRTTTPPKHEGQATLSMSLNRYIHASVDNLKIEPLAPAGNLKRRPAFRSRAGHDA